LVIPFFDAQRGHPMRFTPICGGALTTLSGDKGAAIVSPPFESLRWPVQDAGCIADVDHLADLERARALLVISP
jgi:molybdenum cofactor cytidylyltransferase